MISITEFDNMAEMVLYSYESDDFKEQVKGLWEQLKPLYQQLHAYMRRKLRDVGVFREEAEGCGCI